GSPWCLAAIGSRGHLGALDAPGIEFVHACAAFPYCHRARTLAREPQSVPQLEVRLHEIRPERDGSLEEDLRVLVHFALGVNEPQIEVRVQLGTGVLVLTQRLRQMFDRLAEDSLLEADVTDVDA